MTLETIKIYCLLLILRCRNAPKYRLIKHCYTTHKKDCGGNIKFTIYQYAGFWMRHKLGDRYKMRNMDGSYLECIVIYYPLNCTYDIKYKKDIVVSSTLKYYDDLRALVGITMSNKETDFREVPIHFLNKIK